MVTMLLVTEIILISDIKMIARKNENNIYTTRNEDFLSNQTTVAKAMFTPSKSECKNENFL